VSTVRRDGQLYFMIVVQRLPDSAMQHCALRCDADLQRGIVAARCNLVMSRLRCRMIGEVITGCSFDIFEGRGRYAERDQMNKVKEVNAHVLVSLYCIFVL